MRFRLRINGSDGPTARYVGWAPSPCAVRLAAPTSGAVVVRLRNRLPAAGGQVVFKDLASGTWRHEIELTLPGSGSEVAFEVAGRFGHPSVRDGDAAIEIVPAASGEAPEAVPLMVRVRKDAEALTTGERDLLLSAIAILNDAGSGPLRLFREIHHQRATNEMHPYPGFLPWHRAYILDFERELQRIHPAVALPYWCFDTPAPKVFSPDYLGADDQSGRARFSVTNPLLGWATDALPGINRVPLFDLATQPASVPPDEYTLTYSPVFEKFSEMRDLVHQQAHNSFGPFVGRLHFAARDPLFFLLHANIDRLWATWQYREGRMDPADCDAYWRDPTRIGHNLDDTMWPWNGVDEYPRPSCAPGGELAASPAAQAPGPRPRVRDMIDYQGLVDPANRLGFDYLCVPFPPADIP